MRTPGPIRYSPFAQEDRDGPGLHLARAANGGGTITWLVFGQKRLSSIGVPATQLPRTTQRHLPHGAMKTMQKPQMPTLDVGRSQTRFGHLQNHARPGETGRTRLRLMGPKSRLNVGAVHQSLGLQSCLLRYGVWGGCQEGPSAF